MVSSGLHRFVLGDGGVIVAFHRVNDLLPEDGLTISSRKFDRFCRFFRNNFNVVTLDEFVTRLETGQSLAGSLAITFDDGYLDNFEVAAPILRAYSLPATFFVVTGFLGSTIVPEWDARLPRQPGWMTWDQVGQLSREGFDIGAHTRTHVDLGKVNGTTAAAEIVGAREDLLQALGRVSQHFAYPYGQRSHLLDGNRLLVQNAGFRSCMSCHGGLAPAGTDPFRLQRVPIGAWFRSPGQWAFEVLSRRT